MSLMGTGWEQEVCLWELDGNRKYACGNWIGTGSMPVGTGWEQEVCLWELDGNRKYACGNWMGTGSMPVGTGWEWEKNMVIGPEWDCESILVQNSKLALDSVLYTLVLLSF